SEEEITPARARRSSNPSSGAMTCCNLARMAASRRLRGDAFAAAARGAFTFSPYCNAKSLGARFFVARKTVLLPVSPVVPADFAAVALTAVAVAFVFVVFTFVATTFFPAPAFFTVSVFFAATIFFVVTGFGSAVFALVFDVRPASVFFAARSSLALVPALFDFTAGADFVVAAFSTRQVARAAGCSGGALVLATFPVATFFAADTPATLGELFTCGEDFSFG